MPSQTLIQDVISKITKPTLPLREQLKILVRAIQSQIKTKSKYDIKEIKVLQADLKGISPSDVRMNSEQEVTGFVGEIVLYNGVKVFFQNPQVQSRYGYDWVDDAMEVMVPADIRGQKQGRLFGGDKKEWIVEAQKIFQDQMVRGKGGDSITDFFWKGGRPVESKAKLLSRVYITPAGKQVRKLPKEPNIGSIGNPYAKELGSTKEGFIVGWTWVSVRYDNVAEKKLKTWQRKWSQRATDISRGLDNPVKYRSGVEGSISKAWKAVTVEVEAFMPMAINQSDFDKAMLGRIKFAEEEIDNKVLGDAVRFHLEFVEAIIQQARAI